MSIIKDSTLAPSGQRKINWARAHMPALSQIEARFQDEKPFAGLRVAVSVHLEAKTANLGLVLREGGAEVYLTGCNPLSTQDDVAAAVAERGIEPFGIHGVFYKVCGKGVGGIDGFYFRSSFDVYKQMALINPENPGELCDQLYDETGIPVVLMDANDLQRDQLGKSHDFPLTDAEIQDAMQDNPSGQGDELTPLILIRPVK